MSAKLSVKEGRGRKERIEGRYFQLFGTHPTSMKPIQINKRPTVTTYFRVIAITEIEEIQ